jgi:hypothetical protein
MIRRKNWRRKGKFENCIFWVMQGWNSCFELVITFLTQVNLLKKNKIKRNFHEFSQKPQNHKIPTLEIDKNFTYQGSSQLLNITRKKNCVNSKHIKLCYFTVMSIFDDAYINSNKISIPLRINFCVLNIRSHFPQASQTSEEKKI